MWCIQNKEHFDKLFIVAVMCLPTTPYTTRRPISSEQNTKSIMTNNILEIYDLHYSQF